MGASSSKVDNTYIKSDYQKLIENYQLQNVLLKDDFLRILIHCDQMFIEKIWMYHVRSNDHCPVTQYNEIVEQCRFRNCEQWLKYIVNVAGIGEETNEDNMRLIVDWASSYQGLYDLIIKSFQINNANINVSECIRWIDRNLPELGRDHAQYMYKVLTGQSTISEGIQKESNNVISKLNSALISYRILVTLCASLPMSYKSSGKSDEYLFMNANHWIMLYNSDLHGLSTNKFKDSCFDYDGNLLLLIKCDTGIFCLASDVGLKEDWSIYGGFDTKFFQLEPVFKTLVSGSRSVSGIKNGIIFSHFTAKSGRRGLFIGHNPMKGAAIEIDEDLSKISVLGKSEAIRSIEVWAVGSNVHEKINRLKDVRNWEQKEVMKHKNRKIKAEDWIDSPDREILGMGGVNARNADLIGGIDRDQEKHN